ncbi:hypothetical protein PQR62_12945 [Herbaspirillum lusitanum]|jgi:hypothetical protein|uniref:Uncharacterized protein n=1 Tax=Herbaspirillum lusitanum TaxID=213312 RepID=A0ABW9AA16_9BURK
MSDVKPNNKSAVPKAADAKQPKEDSKGAQAVPGRNGAHEQKGPVGRPVIKGPAQKYLSGKPSTSGRRSGSRNS